MAFVTVPFLHVGTDLWLDSLRSRSLDQGVPEAYPGLAFFQLMLVATSM